MSTPFSSSSDILNDRPLDTESRQAHTLIPHTPSPRPDSSFASSNHGRRRALRSCPVGPPTHSAGDPPFRHSTGESPFGIQRRALWYPRPSRRWHRRVARFVGVPAVRLLHARNRSPGRLLRKDQTRKTSPARNRSRWRPRQTVTRAWPWTCHAPSRPTTAVSSSMPSRTPPRGAWSAMSAESGSGQAS